MFKLPVVEEALKRGAYRVELLNAFMAEGRRWESRSARKEHVDELGDTIKRGEDYFCRDNGRVHEVRRLSPRSMDQVLRVVFQDNCAATDFAKHFIKHDDDRWAEVIAGMRDSAE